MQCTVSRYPADKQGPDIVSATLTTDVVAKARGTREIDYNCSDREIVACRCPKHAYIATGSHARVITRHGSWSGPVRFFQLTLTVNGDYYAADVALDIERERP